MLILIFKKVGIKDGSLHLDDVNSELSYNPWGAYKQSKICNVLFTLGLAKRLKGTQVTVNALHPGIIDTEIGRYFADAYHIPNFVYKLINIVLYPVKLVLMKSSNQGAQTQIYCSVAPELENVSGCYFSDCKQKQLLPEVMNDEYVEKMWKMSEDFVKQG